MSFYVSVLPLPCLEGCLCHYSTSDDSNTMQCNNKSVLPVNLLPFTEQLIMTGSNLITLDVVASVLAQVKRFVFRRCNIKHISQTALQVLLLHADIIDISENQMTELSENIMNMKAQLWVGNNPYDCNCDMIWMRDWLQNATNVMDKENITCGPGKWKGIEIQ